MSADTKILLLLVQTNPVALKTCHRVILSGFPEIVVHTACDADEAISLFKEHKHDIVVSDIFMPKKNGIDIAREIYLQKKDTLVIFIGGEQTFKKLILEPHAGELCLHDLVNKPFEVDDLIQSIAEAITIVANR